MPLKTNLLLAGAFAASLSLAACEDAADLKHRRLNQ